MAETKKVESSGRPEINALDNIVIPAIVTRRINALKNLQKQVLDVESKFYEEIHILECKYAALYDPLFEKRQKIVNGDYDPTDDESKWTLDDENLKSIENKDESDLVKDLKDKININDNQETIKGIPDFWLHTFKSTDLISEMIQEHDEPVLKHLRDVRIQMHDQKPYGYTIEFLFDENEYFTNTVLTKTYELSTLVDEKDPFSFDGPILNKTTGCTINWNKGKDVTVCLVKKKQKHKSSGTLRVITKEEKQDSFFNFFDTPTENGMRPSNGLRSTVKDENDEEDDEETLFEADFEIGQFFKDFLVPKAVLYFTGEIVDSADYDDYDEDEEEDEDEDEDEDE